MGRPSMRAGLAMLLLTSIVALPAAAADAPAIFPGQALAEALLELQDQGLPIVFTDRLVRPEMRVAAAPRSADPRQVLDELLLPHGLAVEEVDGTLVVVAAPAAAPSISGTVRAHASSRPLAGAVIEIAGLGRSATSDDQGRFELSDLPPGTYDLAVRLTGFLTAEARRVSLATVGSAQVDFELRPLPFVDDEIVVRPSRLALLLEEAEAPLTLTRRDVENLPHLGRDVFRALPLLPGVAAGDVSARFHVRGGRRDEVEVVLDGQELYEAYHLKDFDSALSSVVSQGLDSVQLTTGAFPAGHGDRMSGVLDMRTRTPSGPRRTELSVSLVNALAMTGGAFEDGRGGWMASARRGFVDLASRTLGDEDPVFWDLFGKLEHDLGERHRLSAHVLRAGDRLDFIRGAAGDVESFDTGYDTGYLWLTQQSVLGDRLLLETVVSGSRVERDRRGGEADDEESFEIADRRRFDVFGLRQDWGFQATPRQSWSFGWTARRYDVRYDYLHRVEREEPDLVLPIPPREPVQALERRVRTEHLGAYVSSRLSPAEPLTVELGARYDRHALTGDTLVSPRLNLAWHPGARHVVRAAWGRFHQSHRPYELQVEDGETRFFPAERAEHWLAGYETVFDGGGGSRLSALRIELYRREIDEPRPRFENLFEALSSFPEVEFDRLRIAPDASRSQGVELILRGIAGPRTDWWLNYAYSEAIDRVDGREVRRPIDQPHAFNAYLQHRLGPRWSVHLAWRLHTGWPTTAASLIEVPDEEGEPEPAVVLGPLRGERLGTYHRLDARVSRQWQTARGRWTLFLDVQNLYDRRNPAGFDLELDDELGVLIDDEESWPGLLPSVGVSWEF